MKISAKRKKPASSAGGISCNAMKNDPHNGEEIWRRNRKSMKKSSAKHQHRLRNRSE